MVDYEKLWHMLYEWIDFTKEEDLEELSEEEIEMLDFVKETMEFFEDNMEKEMEKKIEEEFRE